MIYIYIYKNPSFISLSVFRIFETPIKNPNGRSIGLGGEKFFSESLSDLMTNSGDQRLRKVQSRFYFRTFSVGFLEIKTDRRRRENSNDLVSFDQKLEVDGFLPW